MKTALVTGSSGFIGSHLVNRLQNDGYYVIGADIEPEKYCKADSFFQIDLRDYNQTLKVFQSHRKIDEVYNLACLMGGMGYIGEGKHSYDIMIGSNQIVINIISLSVKNGVKKHFYSSSACVYNMYKQEGLNVWLKESDSYPAMPDLTYGWQKLLSEQMYDAVRISHGFDIRVARFHNIFGVNGTWDGGKEKAPAALSRKVAMAKDGDEIEVWGTGEQQRSFLYIDECLDGIIRLMESDYYLPINIGSDETISINDLAQMVIDISGKNLKIKNIEGNQGVMGRSSDNTLVKEKLNWSPSESLRTGMEKLYFWIDKQVHGNI
jgi:GDP-D-mannose 3', 5'-epimerase